MMAGREMIRAALGGGAQTVPAELDFLSPDLPNAEIMASCNSIDEISDQFPA
jgi:hypothetical protein